MQKDQPAIDVEELLAHREFVRAVALRILGRGSDADDIVQETFTTAIERPPRDRSALRAWLARVARNASLKHLRAGARRSRREERVARAEATPSADDLASRLERHRAVVNAVIELAPMYRTVVLYRFYEGLSPTEIAVLMAVPAATVRTRLRRALAAIRKRLQSEYGGSRRSLALALLPLVSAGPRTAPPIPPVILAGGILVAAKTKLIGLAAVVLVLLAGVILVPKLLPDDAGERAPNPEIPVDDAPALLAANSSAPPAVLPPPVTPLPAGAEEVFVTGRVLTRRRFPVEGAKVRLEPESGGVRIGRTAADGRFRIPAGPRPTEGFARFLLYAQAGDGTAAWHRGRHLTPTSPVEVDVGVVILGPAATLTARVVKDGLPSPGARVVAGLRNLPGVSAVADDAGIVRLPDLPIEQGFVLLIALTETGDRGSAWARLPMGNSEPVEIDVSGSRDVVVTVVEEGTGNPVPGARLSVGAVHELPGMTARGGIRLGAAAPLPTDENGRTVIRGVGADERLEIVPVVPGRSAPAPGLVLYRGTVAINPGDSEVRVVVPAPRTVTWQIEPGESPAPPDGTTLRVIADTPPKGRWNPPPTARIEAGRIVMDGIGNHHVAALAIAVDGAFARLRCPRDEDEGSPASFHEPRSLLVLLREPDGDPAVGVPVSLVGQGNYPIERARATDEEGRIHFADLYAARVEVVRHGIRLGRIALRRGLNRFEAVVPEERVYTLNVRIDGEPGLPADCSVRIVNEKVPPDFEDPVTGEVRFRFRWEGASIPVGFGGQDLRVSRGQPMVVDLETEASAGATVRLLVRSGPMAHTRPELQERGPDGAWQTARATTVPNQGMFDLPPGLVVFKDVKADEVRAIDIYTNRVSEPVRVSAGSAPTEVVLDLTGMALVRGTVEVPEGFSPDEARVIVTATGFDPGHDHRGRPGRGLGTKARFAAWVPEDRPASISVWHPFLRPDPTRGERSVRGTEDGVVLTLVAGRSAVLRLTGAGKAVGVASVRLYRGAVAGEPVRQERVPVADGAVRFGGYEPGQYTLWLDVPGFAPLLVGEVELGEEQTDLGDVALSPGSMLVVRLRPKPGQVAPRTMVEVRPLDGPPFFRRGRSGENGEARISGLLPGHYRVTVWGSGSEVVEVRGDGETVLTMNLP